MPNYNYVIDSSFRPYSLAEMLQPLEIYSNAYKESEAAYDELKNADIFSYLDTLDDSSKAKRIYQRYASDLDRQVKDFTRNGLNMGNRSALTGLRLRYKGEIGQLERAKEKLDKEIESRNQNRAKGLQMLYANDNPSIDDYLGENTPNLYGISTEDLYTKGQNASKAMSSRLYEAGEGNSIMDDYYKEYVERYGLPEQDVERFMTSGYADVMADRILQETGAARNLSGYNLRIARQGVLNGIRDGIVFKEERKPVRNEGKMSASAATQYALQREQMDFNRQTSGYYKDSQGNWKYNPETDLQRQVAIGKAEATAQAKQNARSGSIGKKPAGWKPEPDMIFDVLGRAFDPPRIGTTSTTRQRLLGQPLNFNDAAEKFPWLYSASQYSLYPNEYYFYYNDSDKMLYIRHKENSSASTAAGTTERTEEVTVDDSNHQGL